TNVSTVTPTPSLTPTATSTFTPTPTGTPTSFCRVRAVTQFDVYDDSSFTNVQGTAEINDECGVDIRLAEGSNIVHAYHWRRPSDANWDIYGDFWFDSGNNHVTQIAGNCNTDPVTATPTSPPPPPTPDPNDPCTDPRLNIDPALN